MPAQFNDDSAAHRIRVWAGSLPGVASHAVEHAKLTMPYLFLPVGATPSALSPMRAETRKWAQALTLPSEQADDIVLAVDEAVTNAVEHAYRDRPGTVTLFAAVAADRPAVHIVIADDGTWRAPSANPGFRGRGLNMMRKLADTLDVEHDQRGTTVVMCWSLPSTHL